MKIGTKVIIKSNLLVNKFYGGAIFVPEMEEFLGRGATITEILLPITDIPSKSYGLSIDNEQRFEFTDEMLEFAEVA